MDDIRNNERFADAYCRLSRIQLNPRRHTAADARAHSEAVAALASRLADANGCAPEVRRLLENLGRAHDVGKITGSARPERSLDVLRECGIEDPVFLALVRWHDTALPWYRAASRGEPPSEKAWRRLAGEVDLRLLAMFMVADRVDAPPGWRRNAPTVWFLAQARTRGLARELVLDVPDHPSEVRAGAVVLRGDGEEREVLVVRQGPGFEVPTSGIEWDELPEEAAVRAAQGSAGVGSAVPTGRELGQVDRSARDDGAEYLVRTRYLALRSTESAGGERAPQTVGEPRWLRRSDAGEVPLLDERVRPMLASALSA
jgi:ADP-ribose pyrophosphatase YjhB (NUDIX family)